MEGDNDGLRILSLQNPSLSTPSRISTAKWIVSAKLYMFLGVQISVIFNNSCILQVFSFGKYCIRQLTLWIISMWWWNFPNMSITGYHNINLHCNLQMFRILYDINCRIRYFLREKFAYLCDFWQKLACTP